MHISSALRLAVCCAMLACAARSAVAQPDAGADGPQTMIILDGSGSMWGRLEGEKRAKIDLARDALRTLIGNAPASARLGLMSFGHRRGGDCSDIEVLAPVGDGEIGRIMTPLDKLNPRGKGPLTGAIREAAGALGSAPGSSIILIHDNADNCRQDPCEAAAEIAAAHPDLKIHLVPLGLDPDELARSVCMAKTTGGTVFEAKDAAGVAPALAGAFAAANQTVAPVQAPAAQAGTAPPAPPPPVPGLRLDARLGTAAWPKDVPIHWRIAKGDGAATAFDGTGSQVTVPLDPGPYTVEASSGLVSTKSVLTVAPGPMTETPVTLDGASLKLAVSDAKDAPVSQTALVTLSGPGGLAWSGYARDAAFVLPPGAYKVHVTDNLTERNDTLTLAAGEAVTRPIVLGAGHLELTAFAKPDGPPLDGARFLVFRDDPDEPGGKREVARSGAVNPVFTLPAGTYYVTARYGTAEVRQQVGIGAGDTVKQRMVMGLATLTVSTGALAGAGPKSQGAADPAAKPALSTRIVSLNGEEREVARSRASQPQFTLAAGRYRVEASIGTLNVKATQDVTLEPGSNREAALKLDSALVMLKLAGTPPANAGVSFEVLDAKGALVVRTQQRTPKLVLAPGHYTVRLDVDDKRVEKPIDVGAEPFPRTVELAVP